MDFICPYGAIKFELNWRRLEGIEFLIPSMYWLKSLKQQPIETQVLETLLLTYETIVEIQPICLYFHI